MAPSKAFDWSTAELPKENKLLPLEKDEKRQHCQNCHQLFLYEIKNCSLWNRNDIVIVTEKSENNQQIYQDIFREYFPISFVISS